MLFREWGYVAMSRGRHSNRFYAVAGSPEREEFAPKQDRRRPLDDIATALERSRAELMATDFALRLREQASEDLDRRARELRTAGAGRLESEARELHRIRDVLDAESSADAIVRGTREASLWPRAEALAGHLDSADLTPLVELQAIQAELARRERLAAAGRRIVAPPEMLADIGPRPERPAELDRWRARAVDRERRASRQRLIR